MKRFVSLWVSIRNLFQHFTLLWLSEVSPSWFKASLLNKTSLRIQKLFMLECLWEGPVEGLRSSELQACSSDKSEMKLKVMRLEMKQFDCTWLNTGSSDWALGNNHIYFSYRILCKRQGQDQQSVTGCQICNLISNWFTYTFTLLLNFVKTQLSDDDTDWVSRVCCLKSFWLTTVVIETLHLTLITKLFSSCDDYPHISQHCTLSTSHH